MMVAYNFQPRFADAVERGEKRQTSRREGKRIHAKPGDKVHLFTGMRTKNCRKLGEAVCCHAERIRIEEIGVFGHSGWLMSPETLASFAKADGFNSWDEMRNWFSDTHGLPFIGQMIEWEFLQ